MHERLPKVQYKSSRLRLYLQGLDTRTGVSYGCMGAELQRAVKRLGALPGVDGAKLGPVVWSSPPPA